MDRSTGWHTLEQASRSAKGRNVNEGGGESTISGSSLVWVTEKGEDPEVGWGKGKKKTIGERDDGGRQRAGERREKRYR